MKAIEKAQKDRTELAIEYGVPESSIVWIGDNKYIIIKDNRYIITKGSQDGKK